MTLAEVRKHRERAREWMSVGCPQGCENCHHSDFPCSDRTADLMAATIEWLAERVGVAWATCETCRFGPSCETHECDVAEQQVWKWLRGEA